MQKIQLTHNHQKFSLSTSEAIALHQALQTALTNAGIDPDTYATVKPPKGGENFTQHKTQKFTDC